MEFVARFLHEHSKEDVSYYVAELGEPTMFHNAAARLYFAVSRLQFTRIGPTMRGEVLSEDEAKDEIARLRDADSWQEMNVPLDTMTLSRF